MKDKNTIRKQMLDRRRNIVPAVRKQADKKITTILLARREVQNANVICIYESFSEEVNTRKIIQALIAQKKTIVIPPQTASELIDIAGADVCIVPGVAFDQEGYRLGWGKGYYDRLLSGVSIPKIGLAYSCQIVSRLPREQYDIPMNAVITEKETYAR